MAVNHVLVQCYFNLTLTHGSIEKWQDLRGFFKMLNQYVQIKRWNIYESCRNKLLTNDSQIHQRDSDYKLSYNCTSTVTLLKISI